MMKKHEGFKNLVYIFMKNNPNKRKSEVADRFMAIGIKRATIYRWIKLVEVITQYININIRNFNRFLTFALAYI